MREYERSKLESHRTFLEELLTAEPGITPQALCDPLLAKLGVKGETIGDEPSRDALAEAQKAVRALQQDRSDVKRHRAMTQITKKALRSFAARLYRRDLDQTSMARFYGWVPRGRTLVDKIPQTLVKTATFLAALRCNRVEALDLFDGP